MADVEWAAALKPLDNVSVHSLVSRPELNGRIGMVTSALDTTSGRVHIHIDGEPKPVALKPANIEESGLPVGCKTFIGATLAGIPAAGNKHAVQSGCQSGSKKRKQSTAPSPTPVVSSGASDEDDEARGSGLSGEPEGGLSGGGQPRPVRANAKRKAKSNEAETETETAAELKDRGLAAFGEKDFQVREPYCSR